MSDVSSDGAVAAGPTPGVLDVGLAIREGWTTFARHPTAFIFFGFLSGLVLAAPAALASQAEDPVVALVGLILWTVAVYPIRFGMITGGLAARRRTFTFGSFFESYHWSCHFFAIEMFTTLSVAVGLVLCVIPGIALSIILSFAPYALVEFSPEMTIGGAISTAWGSSIKSFWRLVLFEIAMVGILVAGLLCFGLGIFIAIPVISLSRVSAFAQIAGTSNGIHTPPNRCGC